jgi:hypothetical protein
MAKFLKHIGKQGDRKVAVVFRQVPGDEHMCLVVYTELLNQNIHDPLMACIESDVGQSVENLGEALDRSYTKDGRQILQVLHREGMLKRIQTEQVVMTPVPGQTIRLNELNNMLNEMSKGEEAVRKLAEYDASRGLQDPKDVAKRMRGESTIMENSRKAKPSKKNEPVVSSTTGLLGDADLARNLQQQAARMAAEAKSLLAESDRLLREAAGMMGVAEKPAPAKKTKAVKVAPVAEPVVEPVKKRGRKPKAVVAE